MRDSQEARRFCGRENIAIKSTSSGAEECKYMSKICQRAAIKADGIG